MEAGTEQKSMKEEDKLSPWGFSPGKGYFSKLYKISLDSFAIKRKYIAAHVVLWVLLPFILQVLATSKYIAVSIQSFPFSSLCQNFHPGCIHFQIFFRKFWSWSCTSWLHTSSAQEVLLELQDSKRNRAFLDVSMVDLHYSL